MENIPKAIDLTRSVWIDENTLLYFDYNRDYRVAVNTYDVKNERSRTLWSRNNFTISKITYDPETNIAYFFNKDDQGWYELEL